ncbi:hypothetical protein KP509_1Z187800 [Ceratopteris richardii]|nr:hypothetical protein KP509_1Z187800 [Ceratopteris richardii]
MFNITLSGFSVFPSADFICSEGEARLLLEPFHFFIAILICFLSQRSLQVIASFRKKFQSFYKEKELLGSSRNMGIAGMYLQDLLSAENIYHRNIFGEFFSHSSSCSLAKHVPFNISMQVPPIRNFCKHIQLMWLDPYSILWSCQSITKDFEIAKGSSGMIRRVLRSDSLGVSVLGFLRFSSVTGRLQLFDATGAIDVVIPDLQTAQCPQGACQVTTYELVIEGHAESLGNQIKDQRFLPLSWYSLLKGISVKMEASKNVSFYMIFMLKEARGLTYIRQPYFGFFPERECEMQLSSLIPKDANKESCNFDVLFVTHKYPVRLKQLCKSTGQGSLSFCVEVVRLPYTIKIFHGCRGLLGNNDAGGGQGSVACAISVLSLKDFFNMSGKVTDSVNGIRGYKRYNSLLSLIKCGSKAERLFVQFSDAQPTAFQIIQIGELYLSKSSRGSRWTNLISGSTFWSLKINHDFCGPIEANNVHMVYTSEYESNFPLVDAILRVPPSLEFELGFSLSDAKSILSPILSISQAMNSGKSVVHTEHMPETGMSKGCMVSLCGIVGTVDAEILFPSSSTEGHGLCCQKTFALKDMNHSHSIMVYCNSQVYFPVGFASGAVVAIHKALLKVSPDGEVSIECICSTLIHVCCAGSDSTLWKCETHVDQDYCKIEKQNCITLDLVTQIDAANSFVPKPFKISCRVVSVQRLILETTEATRRYLKSVETAIYTVRHVSLTLGTINYAYLNRDCNLLCYFVTGYK